MTQVNWNDGPCQYRAKAAESGAYSDGYAVGFDGVKSNPELTTGTASVVEAWERGYTAGCKARDI